MEYETIHTVEHDTAVTVRAKNVDGIRIIATFDRGTKVSEWRAAVQRHEEIEFAEGYAKARSYYRESYQKPNVGVSELGK